MKPVLQALVLAERIYTDQSSGKKIIAGTFNTVHIAPMPAGAIMQLPDGSKQQLIMGGTDPGCPVAYMSLTDIVDGTKISLQFVDVSRNKTLFGTGYEINVTDRLATVEIVAPLPPFARFVQEGGNYSLDAVWEGENSGGSLRVRVIKHDEPSAAKEIEQ